MTKLTKKCPICKYIKKEGFPFGFNRKRYYIDTEGCFTQDCITINYCPHCGRKLINEQN